MHYVYILESINFADRFYVGVTADLRACLMRHNQGDVAHPSKYRPWRLKTYLAFSEPEKAFACERYLKSGSGHAFSRKCL